MPLSFALICAAVGVLIFIGISLQISWSVHKHMVRDSTTTNIKGNFKDFKREFSKIHWRRSDQWKNSFFEVDGWEKTGGFSNGSPILMKTSIHNSQIHANIIEFNSVGMKLDFISYQRFRLWLAFKNKRLNKASRRDYNLEKLLN